MSLLVARRGILAAGGEPAPVSDDFADEINADSPLWWARLHETSGSTASDEVGTNDLTLFGVDLNTVGPTGGGAILDGVDDYGKSSARVNITTALTLEALVYVDRATSTEEVFGNYVSHTPRGYTLRISNLAVDCFLNAKNEGFSRTARSVDTVTQATWTIIAMTWSTTDNGGVPQLYINGSEVSSYETANAQTSSLDEAGIEMMLGVRDDGAGNPAGHFKGRQAEPVVFGTKLSAARIAAHAAAAGLGS